LEQLYEQNESEVANREWESVDSELDMEQLRLSLQITLNWRNKAISQDEWQGMARILENDWNRYRKR